MDRAATNAISGDQAITDRVTGESVKPLAPLSDASPMVASRLPEPFASLAPLWPPAVCSVNDTGPGSGPDDELTFAEEEAVCPDDAEPWLILVVDDEADVHAMTQLILCDAVFLGRHLKFLSAYSAAEALDILRRCPDIAVILLDVVMENDTAGLDLVRAIRQDLGNRDVRVILRTGQPGLAPQREVIIEYDINDYRSKADLSSEGLFIACISALRTFDYIRSIEEKVEERTVALRASHTRLRKILDSCPSGVAGIGMDGMMVYCNDYLATMIGVPRSQMVAQPIRDMFARLRDYEQQMQWFQNRQPMRDVETRLKRADGSLFWALLACDVTDLEGTSVFLLWVHDITERKNAELILEEAKRRAEQAAQAKAAFLAIMSHEIRSPMNGVLGMLEMLERTRLDAMQAEKVATIRESADWLLRVIDDILDFSKIEAGRLDLEQVPVNVGAITEGVAATLAPTAQRKGLELRVYVDPQLPGDLLGDPVRLRQILFNLTSNAIKFTERGRVTIRLKPEAFPPDIRDVFPDEGEDGPERVWVRLEVEDTGIGIPVAVQNRLFQPFTQADNSTTRRFGGTGLGLSICRRLVELMTGAIGLDSRESEGSCFWVRIPLIQVSGETASRPEEPVGARQVSLEGVRVRVEVSDAEERHYIARYLEVAGATITIEDTEIDAVVADDPTVFALITALENRMAQPSDPSDSESARSASLAQTRERLPVVLVRSSLDERSLPGGRPIYYLSRPLRRATLLRKVATAAFQDENGRRSGDGCGLDEDPPSQTASACDADAATAICKRILVAEDNPTNRRVVAMQLAMLGYEADVMDGSLNALEALRRQTYALLLTDCHMPDMDGLELTRRIRTLEMDTDTRMPIIAFTANAMTGERDRCLAAGMDDYLSKPLDLAKLGAALERWIGPPPNPTGNSTSPGGSAANAAPPASTPTPTAPIPVLTPPASPPPPATVAPRPRSDLPVLDRRALTAICGDDAELIREMAREFTTVGRQIIGDMRRGLDNASLVEIREAAHNLKGSARTAGALALADAAHVLEERLRTPDWEILRQQVDQVEEALRAVEGFILQL